MLHHHHEKPQKKIFIVDDNQTNLAAAKEALKDDYSVMCMLSAEKMFHLLEKITPDLILLDIEMPEMNGFDALAILRKSENPEHSKLKVIFLTSHGSGDNVKMAAIHGADGFIIKPFIPSELRIRVLQHLK